MRDYIIKSWSAEQHKQQKQQQEQKAKRYAAYKEFRESVCDLFGSLDFQYYSELTGINVYNLKNMAVYSDSPHYRRPARDRAFRRWFYINNGHSITKPLTY